MEIILEIFVGFVLASFIGLTGIGGAILLNPVLIHGFGLAPVVSVGTCLVFIFITKIFGSLSHSKLKNIHYKACIYFLIGAFPGLVTFSNLLNHFYSIYDKVTIDYYLKLLMGIIILISALILGKQTLKNQCTDSMNLELSKKSLFLLIIFGFFTGSIIGLTSIGGGVFVIPILICILGIRASQAVGSSILISLVLSFAGGFVYLLSGNIKLLTAIFLSIGSFPGILLGSYISTTINDRVLKIIMLLLILTSGFSLIFMS
ncbi:MAG: sulfite exporter TauE/SafE family protein [Pseudomonadota bacterium]